MPNIVANWPAPDNITALTTTRTMGVSKSEYASNNLAMHVGDDNTCVLENRLQLSQSLLLPGTPVWLEQTHSNHCIVVEEDTNRKADAAVTRDAKHPLVIMTADCLPIVLCNRLGTEIAAIHAGWRGLVNGIIENTLQKMQSAPNDCMAWVGPAICKNCFEVGDEVLETYINRYPFADIGFNRIESRLFANLSQLAELILNSCGINSVFQSEQCTFEHADKFYSYRRNAQTGRIATLIWFNVSL